MATITIQPAETVQVDTDTLVLRSVTDNQIDTITTRIDNVWRDIILWQGVEEYTEAGVWTNESALQRAKDLINSGNVRFA